MSTKQFVVFKVGMLALSLASVALVAYLGWFGQ